MSTATVLSVDDDPNDLMLLRLACREAKVSFELQCVESGEKAIAYLEAARPRTGGQDVAVPDLILLDLKMPGQSGFEVLAWIRAQSDLNRLPVIILTSSVHPEDRERAFKLGADQFVVKPVGYCGLERLVRTLDTVMGVDGPLNRHALERLSTQRGEMASS